MASLPEYQMPRLQAIRGQRIHVVDLYEPAVEDLIPFAALKQLTGGDTIYFRN
jgi:hypothetical protein